MKAGDSVFVLFCELQISITKSCHESGRARAYWKTDRLQNAASQSPSMLRFPHWMACQWWVEMGFVWEVGLSCVGPDNGVGSWCQLQQVHSGFIIYYVIKLGKKSSFNLFPSSPLLFFFRHFSFVQHFSQSIFFSSWTFSFFFLSCISSKKTALLTMFFFHESSVRVRIQKHTDRFTFLTVRLHKSCLYCIYHFVW